MIWEVGDWDQLERILGALKGTRKRWYNKCIRSNLMTSGYKARAEIHDAIRNREFAPNAPSTLRAKAPKDIPLIDTGQLMRSITVKPTIGNKLAVFVGILKQTRRRDGQSMVNIAAVLHEGAVIRRGNAVIRIPARPFIRRPIESPEFRRWWEKHMLQAIIDCLAQVIKEK